MFTAFRGSGYTTTAYSTNGIDWTELTVEEAEGLHFIPSVPDAGFNNAPVQAMDTKASGKKSSMFYKVFTGATRRLAYRKLQAQPVLFHAQRASLRLDNRCAVGSSLRLELRSLRRAPRFLRKLRLACRASSHGLPRACGARNDEWAAEARHPFSFTLSVQACGWTTAARLSPEFAARSALSPQTPPRLSSLLAWIATRLRRSQ